MEALAKNILSLLKPKSLFTSNALQAGNFLLQRFQYNKVSMNTLITNNSKYKNLKIWMNGKVVDYEDANVSILVHTLHYGTGVFEGIRSYGRLDGTTSIFKLEQHLNRLRFSASHIDLEIKYSNVELTRTIRNLLELNNLQDAYIRPIGFKGPEDMKLKSEECSSNLAIGCWEMKEYFKGGKNYIEVDFSKYKKLSNEYYPVGTKVAGTYTLNLMASKNFIEGSDPKKQFDDAIMIDDRGYIAELTTSNIFGVDHKGDLITPTTRCCLNGITRQTVIDIAKKIGIKVIERDISPEELIRFKELFATGTAVEVKPITRVGTKEFEIGNITDLLMGLYKQEVLK